MMRVGVLRGGLELESEMAVPPSQKLRVLSHAEITTLISPNGADVHDERARPESPPPLSDQGVSSGGEEDLPSTPVEELSFEVPTGKL
jgi:hypothetical protein